MSDGGNTKPGVADRIAQLEREARIAEAAELASGAGMHARAAQLFEQSCSFDEASRQATLAGDTRRAVVLAAISGDTGLIDAAVDAVVRELNRARAASEELRSRGHGLTAARILEKVGDLREAAEAYAAAGDAIRAARACLAAGDPRQAARILESAHRARPDDVDVAIELATLLTAHRRFEAATRLLQRIEERSPRRRDALTLLLTCYRELGLEVPYETARAEAKALGIDEGAADKAPDRDPPELNRVVYGRYEIQRPVASTPSARVFEAIDRLTGARVAVKQIRMEGVLGGGRDAFERLVREAKALEQIRHPHVVPLVELITQGAAIVTPWMAGGSLADLMERERVTPSRAVAITCAVLGVLAEAHRLGILHRDVKPSNILFDDAGTPLLADFGAAHVSDASATATAGVIGTLAYMSPEQRYGQPATAASDVYSVGATLLEMLTGRPPSATGGVIEPPSNFHADLGPEHDGAILSLIHEQASMRPHGALAAREILRTLVWPIVLRGGPLPTAEVKPRADGATRMQVMGPDIAADTWLDRRVRIVAQTDATKRAAQAYAAIASPHLAAVVRVDAEAGTIWFELPAGTPLAEVGTPLGRTGAERLRCVLEALHQRGVTHGAVDGSHVLMRAGEPVLVFEPSTVSSVQAAEDLNALGRLTGREA